MNKTHKLLSENLKGINELLNSIASGGCGLFAYLLELNLKSVGIDSKIVLVDCGGMGKSDVKGFIGENKDINEAYRTSLKNRNSGYWCHSHIAVEYDGTIYDNDGICEYRAISEGIEPEIMASMVEQESEWNPSFRRSNQDVDCKEIINTFLKTLFTENNLSLGGQ